MRRPPTASLATAPLATAALAAALVAAAVGCSRSGLGGDCAPAASIRTGDATVSIAAVDEVNVYWFRTGADPALRAAPRCGGAPITVTAASAFRAVAAGGGRIFFVDAAGTLQAAPRAGGSPVALAPAAAPLALSVQRRDLLWMAADGFHLLALDDPAGGPHALGPAGFAELGRPLSFVADDAAIYWLASADGAAPPSLLRFGRVDASVAILVPGGPRLGAPAGGLATFGAGELAFTGLGGDVLAVARVGGPVRALAAYQTAISVAASLGHVWWTSAAATTGPHDPGALRRMALAGGAVEAAGGPAHPSSPMVDGDAVWVDDGRDLFRLAD